MPDTGSGQQRGGGGDDVGPFTGKLVDDGPGLRGHTHRAVGGQDAQFHIGSRRVGDGARCAGGGGDAVGHVDVRRRGGHGYAPAVGSDAGVLVDVLSRGKFDGAGAGGADHGGVVEFPLGADLYGAAPRGNGCVHQHVAFIPGGRQGDSAAAGGGDAALAGRDGDGTVFGGELYIARPGGVGLHQAVDCDVPAHGHLVDGDVAVAGVLHINGPQAGPPEINSRDCLGREVRYNQGLCAVAVGVVGLLDQPAAGVNVQVAFYLELVEDRHLAQHVDGHIILGFQHLECFGVVHHGEAAAVDLNRVGEGVGDGLEDPDTNRAGTA